MRCSINDMRPSSSGTAIGSAVDAVTAASGRGLLRPAPPSSPPPGSPERRPCAAPSAPRRRLLRRCRRRRRRPSPARTGSRRLGGCWLGPAVVRVSDSSSKAAFISRWKPELILRTSDIARPTCLAASGRRWGPSTMRARIAMTRTSRCAQVEHGGRGYWSLLGRPEAARRASRRARDGHHVVVQRAATSSPSARSAQGGRRPETPPLGASSARRRAVRPGRRAAPPPGRSRARPSAT